MSGQGLTVVLLDELPAVHDWHHEVQDDQVGSLSADSLERFGAVGGFADFIAVVAEDLADEIADRGVVFHYENPRHQCSMPGRTQAARGIPGWRATSAATASAERSGPYR